jgi:FkbM family methyltransferase
MHNGNDDLINICSKYGPIKRIFDCGSRDAKDGIYLADMLKAEELHIFEPNPESATVCLENLKKTSGFKWIMNPVAVSDDTGTVDFYVNDKVKTKTPHPNGNIGAASMFLANPDYPNEKYEQLKITVPSITLDEYICKNGSPGLLWMDLQGAELKALLGLKNNIKDILIVHIEVGFRPIYIGQPLFWDLDEILRGYNFKLISLDTGKWPMQFLWIYKLLKTGPWVANAIYLNNNHSDE